MERNISINYIKAFGENINQGSLVGVCYKEKLTIREKQNIAKKIGLPEVVFIYDSDKADFKFEFFTPLTETNLCGIGIVGGIIYLLKEKNLQNNTNYKIETRAGFVNISVNDNCKVTFEQAEPKYYQFNILKDEMAKALNIDKNKFTNQSIEIVSTGVPKVIIGINNLETLQSINPNYEKLIEISKKTDSKGFYLYTLETIDKNNDYHARQFNPLMGINEDPITGIAAGALGAFIKKYNLSYKKTLVIEQGFIMNLGGLINVEISDKIKVGGKGFLIKKENFKLE